MSKTSTRGVMARLSHIWELESRNIHDIECGGNRVEGHQIRGVEFRVYKDIGGLNPS